LTPPAFFINVLSRATGSFEREAYRNERAHLLTVLLSAQSAHVQRMTAVKWISIFIEGKPDKFERVPQKFFGFSPHLVMSNDCKHRF
jgi:hypothetical protein